MKNSSQSVIKNYRSIPDSPSNISDSRPSPVWFSFGNSSRTFSSCPAWKPALNMCEDPPFLPMVASRCCLLSMCWQDIDDCATSAFTKHDPLIKRGWASTCFPISQPFSRILATADEPACGTSAPVPVNWSPCGCVPAALQRHHADFDGPSFHNQASCGELASATIKAQRCELLPLFCTSLRQDRSSICSIVPERPRLPWCAGLYRPCIDEVRWLTPHIIKCAWTAHFSARTVADVTSSAHRR